MPVNKWENTTNSITYNSWRSMRNRCLYDNANNVNHKLKGITICDAWINNYDQFITDMGHRPEGTTLDRIDSYGNYEPSNCRWASWRVQENNKPNLTKIEHDGNIRTIGEWAYILDLTPTELATAYKRHANYGARTFDELFYSGRLLTKRVQQRSNKCLVCGTESSCKWRKFGTLCNTCYARALRWAKKTTLDIETFPEWSLIDWPKEHQHLSS